MHWQIVSYESEEENEEPYARFLSVLYNIPEEIKNDFDTIQYLLTGGPASGSGDDGRFSPVCGLNFTTGNSAILSPGEPISYRNDPVESVFCMITIRDNGVDV